MKFFAHRNLARISLLVQLRDQGIAKSLMVITIKSVADLPDWYRNKSYKKRLSKIDWFREIRKREVIMHLLKINQTNDHPLKEFSSATKETFLKLLETSLHPNSTVFLVSQSNRPVHALTAGEALYFRSAIRDKDLHQFAKKYDELLSLWHEVCDEDPAGPTPRFGNYESEIGKFFVELERHSFVGKLGLPIEDFLNATGNPWLSYGRPLNGTPITVDTQYDDETIIRHFKEWLSKKRAAEGERARRPFVQNDFDDWEYFKIREIFDLETWATVMNVKILDRVIAHSLWPNPTEDFSPIDVLRTTARKKVKEVFNSNVVVRLNGQLLLEDGENFLEQ